jgi:hypothetical protein
MHIHISVKIKMRIACHTLFVYHILLDRKRNKMSWYIYDKNIIRKLVFIFMADAQRHGLNKNMYILCAD